MSRFFTVALTGALLALAGCAEPFNARVSRFQQLPPPQGQTFVIQPLDQKLRGGLEFAHYADLVTAKLVQVGYRPAREGDQAQYVVKLGYKVDHGRERLTATSSGFGYGGFGYGGLGYGGFGYGGFGRGYGYGRGFGYGHGYAFGFYDPWLYGSGFDDISSYTIFTSELDLQIDRADSGQRVFEGVAKGLSRDDALPHLVPNLVDAMFTGFPGNSGETVKVTIAPEKRKA